MSFGQLIKALSMTLAVQILLLLFMFRQESTAYYPCKNELDNQLHPLLQLQFFFFPSLNKVLLEIRVATQILPSHGVFYLIIERGD